jgi:hypothetical protein
MRPDLSAVASTFDENFADKSAKSEVRMTKEEGHENLAQALAWLGF